MLTWKTPTRLLALVLASLVTGSPGSLSAQAAGARGGASFSTHALTSAPHAAPRTGSLAPSSSPRAQKLAALLGERLAAIRARQAAAATAAGGPRQGALVELRARAGEKVQARFRSPAGTPRFIKGRALARPARSAQAGPQRDRTTARRFLRENRRLLALDDPDAELELLREERDRLGRSHVRFAQRYAGLEVWPAHLTVHLDPQGNVDLMNGAYVATPRRLQTEPELSASGATERARAFLAAGAESPASSPELIVYAPGDRAPRLAWRLVVHQSAAFDMLVVVDALGGDVLTSFNRSHTTNVAGSGVDIFGQTRSLNVWSEGGQFFLADTSKQMFDPTSDPPEPNTTRGAIIIQDAMNQPPNASGELPPNLQVARSISATSGWVPDGVSAAAHFSTVYDYYLSAHGRDSLDGRGGQVLAVVRLGLNFQNAFFNPGLNLMGFGDGKPYAGALDIVAHELSHGVTFHSSDLVYQDQPGALNESMSDIFGEIVEGFASGQAPDWLNGTVFPQPSRSLSDPGSIEIIPGSGRAYPAKFSEFLGPGDPFLDNFFQRDNGGVHINSSIPNHAFYQLAAGLPGAIGTDDAAAIFYRANTVHLVQNSQFFDARLACIQSAEELFGAGSPQAQKTAEAFDFVEIVDGQQTPDPPIFPGTEGDDSTLFIFFDAVGGACNSFPGEYCVGRKEPGLDDPDGPGTALSLFPVLPTRVSVTGDGAVAVFVDFLNDVCLIDTLTQQEECLFLPDEGIFVHSVAMSPAGLLFGFVLLDAFFQPDNFITVVDLLTEDVVDFELLSPALDSGTLANVRSADAVDFTANQQFMIYDAFNEISLGTAGTFGAWSIYAIDLFSGTTFAIVPPFLGLDFGFPALSQRSDNFMVFDVFDEATGLSTIHTLDLNTGEAVPVIQTQGFGVPGYTGDDTAIVFSLDDAQAPSGFSLVRQPIAADGLTPVGSPSLWLADADFGTIYRRGTFDPTPLAECEDGRDNDADGLVDFPQDPGCESAADPLEVDPVPEPGALLLQLAALLGLGAVRRRRWQRIRS